MKEEKNLNVHENVKRWPATKHIVFLGSAKDLYLVAGILANKQAKQCHRTKALT